MSRISDLSPVTITTRMQSGDITFDPITSTLQAPALAPIQGDINYDQADMDPHVGTSTPTVTVSATKLPWPLILGAAAVLVLLIANKK